MSFRLIDCGTAAAVSILQGVNDGCGSGDRIGVHVTFAAIFHFELLMA